MTVIPDPNARTHQEKNQERRHLVARAIEQATANDWLGAIATNQRLIDASCAAYDAALRIDPANSIARRHAVRLAAL